MAQLEESVEQVKRKALYARHDKLTPEQQGDFLARVVAIDADDLDAVEKLIDDIEHPLSMIDAAKRRVADDRKREAERRQAGVGGPADEADVNEFTARWELAMNDDGRAWVAQIVMQAIERSYDFRWLSPTLNTQRRADIYCALTEWTTIDGFLRDTGARRRTVPHRHRHHHRVGVRNPGDDGRHPLDEPGRSTAPARLTDRNRPGEVPHCAMRRHRRPAGRPSKTSPHQAKADHHAVQQAPGQRPACPLDENHRQPRRCCSPPSTRRRTKSTRSTARRRRSAPTSPSSTASWKAACSTTR